MRWQHPDEGLLPPGAFLPVIEGSSLEADLDDWVLDRAVAQLTTWSVDGLDLELSVNISPRNMSDPAFPDRLAQLLDGRRAGLAERLELEVIETSAVGPFDEVAVTMQRCADLGVRFSLDDFGTGYSSLSYFHSLPIHMLKIDRGFVSDMLTGVRDLDIVEGVIQLARAFDRPVVAEGVESVEVGLLLQRLGCQYAQGFALARPMPADELPGWIDGFAESAAWAMVADGVASPTDR
ncbi:MAG: EAL domain-containing protein, partial [Ilumatobacter sp.]|nr:EAL domain-containing protein [Ilumatobacter sp.]